MTYYSTGPHLAPAERQFIKSNEFHHIAVLLHWRTTCGTTMCTSHFLCRLVIFHYALPHYNSRCTLLFFFCNPAVVIRTMLTLETGHSFNSLMLGFRYSTAQKQSLFLQYVRLRRSWAVGWQMKLQPWTVGSIPRVDCWVLISNHCVHKTGPKKMYALTPTQEQKQSSQGNGCTFK